MNNKLLLGAAAAGLAAMFLKKRRDAKRNTASPDYASNQDTFKKSRHRTDLFSQAKNTGEGTWNAAPESAK